MDKIQQTPLDWIRQIPGELLKLDEAPLLGSPPLFPWDDFAKELNKAFQFDGFKLSPSEWQWRSKDELFAGLGDQLSSLALTVVPLSGLVYWVVPEQQILQIMGFLLSKGKELPTQAIDGDFRDAFYRFLTVEVLAAFEKVDFDKKISLNLMQNTDPPADHCLCLDVGISLKQELTIHGRLLLTKEFRKSWVSRYLPSSQSLLTSPMSDKLNLLIHLEAGNVRLKLSEWKQVQIGDFLLLDACSLDPDEDKGRVMLVINEIPFFRGKIKQGNIKILEHPLYHEVSNPMTNPPGNQEKDHHPDDDDFEDTDLDASMLSEFDDHTETESELEDEFDIEDEDLSDIDSQEKQAAPTPPTQSQPNKSEETTPSVQTKEGARPAAIEDIPLNIIIEVGRLQMSIKKIMELQPGNLLELNIHPEKGVDLVINSKCVARGELLRIGETLGVRIIELS